MSEYRADLERLSNQVTLLESGEITAQALHDSLPAVWVMRDAEQRFEISTARIQAALDHFGKPGGPPAIVIREIRLELQALRQEADEYVRASAFARLDAKEKLSRILGRREFGAVQPPSRMGRWWVWLVQQIFRLLDRLLDAIPIRSVTAQALVWLLIAAVFIFLALLMRRTLRNAPRGTTLRLEPAPGLEHGWREWIQKAQVAALRGDNRHALHAAYWAGVLRLEETGVWTLDRSRTPREYLGLLDAHGTLRPALAALTSRFEMTWYGYREAAPEDFREALTHLEALGCQLPSTLATARS